MAGLVGRLGPIGDIADAMLQHGPAASVRARPSTSTAAKPPDTDAWSPDGLANGTKRGVGIVVDADRSEPTALTPNVDSDPGFRRQLGLAPSHDVVLQRARAPVVDDRAKFEWDAAVVREQQLIEGTQAVWASVDVLAARRLAGVPVRFECRHHRVDVAGRERMLIFGDDVWFPELRVGL